MEMAAETTSEGRAAVASGGEAERRRAFEATVAACMYRLRAKAAHMCRAHLEPEDVLQDALVRALCSYEQLRDPGRVRPWLFAAVKRSWVCMSSAWLMWPTRGRFVTRFQPSMSADAGPGLVHDRGWTGVRSARGTLFWFRGHRDGAQGASCGCAASVPPVVHHDGLAGGGRRRLDVTGPRAIGMAVAKCPVERERGDIIMNFAERTNPTHLMVDDNRHRTGETARLSVALALAMSCGALLFGCSTDPQDEAEGEAQEIIDNLIEAGFPPTDIQIVDGAVYVGRDAHVTLAASREMLQRSGSSEEQYRTANVVSGKPRICVNPSAEFNSDPVLSQGLDLAIENYNVLGLVFSFARVPTTGCSADISAVAQVGLVGGSAGFPSGGNPYMQIIIGTGVVPFGLDVTEHVITHELGHTIGFRHSDYFNRSISCGSGGDEGDAGIGAILVPGTPSTAMVGGSVMNSCFSSTETGEFTSSDITALNMLNTYSYSATNTDSALQNTVNQNITLSAGQSITVGTCGVAGGSFLGDTFLRLFGPAGTQVAANDDACGGLGSNLTFTATATGTYQLRAGCFSSNSCSGTVAWTVSPNQYDYSATNTNSALQNTVNRTVTLNAGQTLTIGTCGVAGGGATGDTYLRLFNASGTQVAFNDDACGGLGSNMSFTATTAGNFEIRAGCFSSLSCSGTVAWNIQ